MAASDFPHLEIFSIERGIARLEGGGDTSDAVRENKANRREHAERLGQRLERLTHSAVEIRKKRTAENLPDIPGGAPFVLHVDDPEEGILLFLSEKLGIEVIAEEEEGFILVATDDIEAARFHQIIAEFVDRKHGSGQAANVLDVVPENDSEQRLGRILTEDLQALWPLADNDNYVMDVSIKSPTADKFPTLRRQRKNETAADFEQRRAGWTASVQRLIVAVDEERIARETSIEQFVAAYNGEFLTGFIDAEKEHSQFAELSDSFSTRIRMSGAGFKDLILNFPYIFEAALPEEFNGPRPAAVAPGPDEASVHPPANDAPAVCIIDSGIQEQHLFLAAAIDSAQSRCFLPGLDPSDAADYVGDGGHGTRVAGAALYGAVEPGGDFAALFWIQNARILDKDNWLPINLFPPLALQRIVAHFRHGPRLTRIFNHSIASNRPCWTRRMSTWATEIDRLSNAEDVLFIQAIGNLFGEGFGALNNPSIADHIAAGRPYPEYLFQPSARLANPSQSLQALTVGSVALSHYNNGDLSSFAGAFEPSSFSRTGLGLWNSVKPDIVEFGGDFVRDPAERPALTTPPDVCPSLVRSTFNAPGPASARDTVGTSFSAPKVSHIAGRLAADFPDQPTLLYRALIAQSARWPEWAENRPAEQKPACLRHIGYGVPDVDRATQNDEFRITLITHGLHQIRAREAAIFAIPIPEELRRPGLDADIRVEVTLSYAAEPRRTRSSRRGYLAVWLDWIASHLDEGIDHFRNRALRTDAQLGEFNPIRWTLDRRTHWGEVRGVSRGGGTLQKDWALIKSYNLPDMLAVAVRGHPGWSFLNPDATANFALAVTLEAVGRDVPVYVSIQQAIEVGIPRVAVPIEV